jgi:hypothetical protein
LSLGLADAFLAMEEEKRKLGLSQPRGKPREKSTSFVDTDLSGIDSDEDTPLPTIENPYHATMSAQTESALLTVSRGVEAYLKNEGDVTSFALAKRKVRELLEQQRDVLESAVVSRDRDANPREAKKDPREAQEAKEKAAWLERSLLMAPRLTLFSTLACAGRAFALRALDTTL